MAIKMFNKPPSDQNNGQTPKTKSANNLTFDKAREGVVDAQKTLYGRDQNGNINATVENKNPIKKSGLPALEGENPAFKKTSGTQTTPTNTKSVSDIVKNKRGVKLAESSGAGKIASDGKNGNTGQEANINDDTARKETLKNAIQGANKTSYSFDLKPAYIKASSLHETIPIPVINVRFLTVSGLPSFGQIGYREDEIDFANTIPPNLIKSFEFNIGGGQGQKGGVSILEIEDTTFYEGEALLSRISIAQTQLKRPSAFRITFGWSEVDRVLPRSIKRRHFPNFTRDFILNKVESTVGKSSVNYKFYMTSDNREFPAEIMLKPYGILGPKPINRLCITDFINKINDFFEKTNIVDSGGNIVPGFREKMVNGILGDYDLSSLFGSDPQKIYDFVKENGKLLADTFYSQYKKFQKITPELEKSSNAVNEAITKNFLDNSINGGSEFEEIRVKYSVWLEKLGQASNLLMGFSHMTDDKPVNSLKALKFIINSYIIQRTSLIKELTNREQARDIPGIVVMSLFSERDVINEQKLERGANKNQEIDKELEDALKGIRAGSIDCNVNQSWEDLIRLLCKQVKIGKGEKDKIPFDKVKNLQCNIFTVPLAQLEQVNGEYRVNENATDDRTYLVFEALEKSLRDSVPLYQKTDPVKASDTLEIAERIKKAKKGLVKVYEDAKKNGLRYLTYIILSEDSSSSFFDYSKWGAPLLQKYDIRPKGQTLTSNRGYFNLGGDSVLDEGLPDVVEFNPGQFNVMESIKNFYSSAFAEVDKEIKVQKKVPDQVVTRIFATTTKTDNLKKDKITENKKEATEPKKETEEEKEVKRTEAERREFDRIAKLKYPIILPAFNQPYLHTDPNELNVNALEMKKNLTNLRRRMMYSKAFSGLQPEMTILGEPYLQEYCINRNILVDYTNPDGSKSFFTGIYNIDSIKHKITQGSYLTTMTMSRVAFDPKSAEFMDALIDDTLIINEE